MEDYGVRVTKHAIILADSRQMQEVADASIHLMVTSPPYPMIQMWDNQFAKIIPELAELLEDRNTNISENTIRQIYEAMHSNLAKVWGETYRVLVNGGIACINIGDATRNLNGKFRLFANHAAIIEHCESIGFTALPYILWKKPTTKPQYKGKGAFLGSGFLPPNAYVTLDCEYILVFRKGNLRKFAPHDKLRYESKFTKKQRDLWFSQIWTVKGIRQTANEVERRTAAFPQEIALRLIQMFSIKGDTVLDPFLGSGTTIWAAMHTERNSIGYEVDESILPLIKNNICSDTEDSNKISIVQREL